MLGIHALQFQFQKSNIFKLTLYCIVVKNRKYTIFLRMFCKPVMPNNTWQRSFLEVLSYIKGAKASIDQDHY